ASSASMATTFDFPGKTVSSTTFTKSSARMVRSCCQISSKLEFWRTASFLSWYRRTWTGRLSAAFVPFKRSEAASSSFGGITLHSLGGEAFGGGAVEEHPSSLANVKVARHVNGINGSRCGRNRLL